LANNFTHKGDLFIIISPNQGVSGSSFTLYVTDRQQKTQHIPKKRSEKKWTVASVKISQS
jgi:hypothetical protein